MKRSILIAGVIVYCVLWAFTYMHRMHVPAADVFGSDGTAYSLGAQHLLHDGVYSMDGEHVFTEREPGYSVFLAVLYLFYGIENVFALYAAQGLLFFLATYFFVRKLSSITGERAAAISFFLLLSSFSIFHAVFSGLREAFTLVLLLTSATAFLSLQERPTFSKTILFGIALGWAILCYYSLLFFPLFLIPFLWILRMPLRHSIAIVCIPLLFAVAWNVRNAVYTGHAGGTGSQRLATVMYVRGVQAESVQGLEPFWCLYAEYISRDWTGRSPACNLNGVKNTHWPEGMAPAGTEGQVMNEAFAKISAHPLSYLWFSLFEVIELHLPLLGGGWSYLLNLLAALTAGTLYLGLPFALPALKDRRLWFLLALPLYNTLFYVVTDAIPRYLIPVLFCYAAFAGIGYDRLLSRIRTFARN